MKKILIYIILINFTFATQSYFFGGGFGQLEEKRITSSELRTYDSDGLSYEAGFSWNKMVIRDFNYKLELGIGAKYQSSIITEDFLKDSYVNTIPLYLNARLSTKSRAINYFIEGQLGYSFVDEGKIIDDLEQSLDDSIKVIGGFYSGIELGAEISDFYVAFNYSASNFTRKESKYLIEKDYRYIKPSIIVGVRF
jgi:hypothetical protein